MILSIDVGDEDAQASNIPNQLDIATAAKVSTATVSRVLNNSPNVSEKTRKRVLGVMEGLQYAPNGAARSLASRKSRMIGAIVPTLKSDLFARGIDALMARLRLHDYSLMVVSSDYSLKMESVLAERLLQHGVDGLFFVGQQRNRLTDSVLHRYQKPYVETYSSDKSARANHIGFSNAKAAETAVDYLVDLGHRRIGMIAGIRHHNDRAARRLTGFRRRLKHHNIALNEAQICETEYDIEASRKAFSKILHTQNPPTALLCGNDLIAMGVLIEARSQSIGVPDELSVVGIDNHPMSPYTWPPLTTVEVPAASIGSLAADELLAAIKNSSIVRSHELDAPLIVRDSAGAISA